MRFLFGFLLSVTLAAAASWDTLGFTHPQRGFVSERPATHWQNSLITGNGIVGALVPGQVNA
ncbi:MAG: hypothetical protein GY824_04700, partial [Delftia sp.]|nr:hypothetical protein [Delftia sp.]